MDPIPKDNATENPNADAWSELAERSVEPVRLDTASLNFDDIKQTFTKIADPNKAFSPEVVTETQEVRTTLRGEDGTSYTETVNTAKPGDAIITGPRGERYVVRRDEFARLYEPLTNEDGHIVEGKYLPKNVVKRIPNPTGQEIVIDAPWGGEQTGEPDCWIVESQINGDRYIIGADEFEGTYRPTLKQDS